MSWKMEINPVRRFEFEGWNGGSECEGETD